MISRKRLRSVLSYDPETGEFVWLKKISKKVVVGKVAGGVNVGGYIVIGIDGQPTYAHRLAWLYMTGKWPKQLDHADGDRQNNRFSNLREANHAENIMNAKLFATNVSGFKGVSWHRGAGKWQASIGLGGKSVYLGLHDTPQDAAAAYINAALAAHPEFARAK